MALVNHAGYDTDSAVAWTTINSLSHAPISERKVVESSAFIGMSNA
jgi:hypothetical protein